jgi:hypothetical protein
MKITGLAPINVMFSMHMYHMLCTFASFPGEVLGEAFFSATASSPASESTSAPQKTALPDQGFDALVRAHRKLIHECESKGLFRTGARLCWKINTATDLAKLRRLGSLN